MAHRAPSPPRHYLGRGGFGCLLAAGAVILLAAVGLFGATLLTH